MSAKTEKTAVHTTNAQEGFDRCKQLVKEAGLSGPGKVRVNEAGCLDRCACRPGGGGVSGGRLVLPMWMPKTLKKSFESHLKNGKVVERLSDARPPRPLNFVNK